MTRRTPWMAPTLLLVSLVGCEGDREHPNEHDLFEHCYESRFTAEIDPAGRALLVNEPEALAGLALKDVLQHLLDLEGDDQTTPLALLQRLFDTSNDDEHSAYPTNEWHCDHASSLAHANGPPAFCPRTEGALAKSTGFFTPGDPDYFYPVAAVHRGDLAPDSYTHCGEARIVYAKASGLTDPRNRVFLIFEAALSGVGRVDVCQTLADPWHEFQSKESPEQVAPLLRRFFFEGPADYGPVLSASNLGLGAGSAAYYGNEVPVGHVRLSQHMDQPWEMRELVANLTPNGRLRFMPTTVGNNPLPRLFGGREPTEPRDDLDPDLSRKVAFQTFLETQVAPLAATSITSISMTTPTELLSGESALGGAPKNDYASRAAHNDEVHALLQTAVDRVGGLDCPEDDPLTTDSILRRATMMSCAGCHAPSLFLGEDRKIGCGMTWPDSLGEVHIDERGNLSPALKEVFLPHRAAKMTALLHTCPLDEEQEP